MGEEKLLSICIPTYNRAVKLDRLLGSLEKEVRGISSGLEICISDNCSPDNTQEVLRKWEKRLPLVWNRNGSNLGAEPNILIATRMAKGKYVWYMGDDDIVYPGSVGKLMSDLRSAGQELVAVHMNQVFNGKWVLQLGFTDFRTFKKEEIKTGLNPSFIGSSCLNRLAVLNVIDNRVEEQDGKLYKKNFGDFILHYFIHAYLFLECIQGGGDVGIEPRAGMIYQAASGLSCERKFYLELLMLVYILEIDKYYPWFRHMGNMYNLRTHFARLALAYERPELEEAYMANYLVLIRVLEMEHKPVQRAAVMLSEALRKVPGYGSIVVFLHKAARSKFGATLSMEPDRNPVLKDRLEYMIKKANRMAGNGGG